MANPGTQTAGTAFNVTITAIDAYGNTATGYAGAKAVTFSGPANSPNGHAPTYPASVTFAAGVGTASVTLFDAQTTTLTATPGRRHRHLDQLHGEPGGPPARSRCRRPGPRRPARRSTRRSPPSTPTATRRRATPAPRPSPSAGRPTRRTGTAPTYPATVTFTAGVGTASITLTDAQTTTLTATQGSDHRHLGQLHRQRAGATTKFTLSTPSPDGGHGVHRDDHRRRHLRQHGDGLHGREDRRLQRPGELAQRHRPDLPGLGDLHRRRGHGLHHPLRRPDHDADGRRRARSPAPRRRSRSPRARPRSSRSRPRARRRRARRSA